MTDHDQISVQVRITGRVQGVWFRGWTIDQASALGLDGWVRNRVDGSVEAAFAGSEPAVREMIRRCHRGPSGARVATVEERPAAEPVQPGFHQLATV
jgi:acylphosphatase